jgi:ferredoxin
MINIIVFSGTGNTLYCAKEISKLLDEESKITLLSTKNISSISYNENVMICFPIYAYTMPNLVRKFLKKLRSIKNLIAIYTYGSSAGSAVNEVKRMVMNKAETIRYFGVKCPENIGSLFKDDEEKNKDTRLKMIDRIRDISKTIKQGDNTFYKKITPFASLVANIFKISENSWLLRKKLAKRSCSSCGLCEKLCPCGAIQMSDYPKFNRKLCSHCQRCIAYCPSKSISMLFQNNKSTRYKNKFIRINEYLDK